MTQPQEEIIITEEYAVELTRTGRGTFAEVKDAGSPYNGVYVLGSTPEMAVGVLQLKIAELQRAAAR